MNKLFSRMVIAFIIGMSILSCVSTPDVPPFTYSGEKPIYPAVYYAIVNGNARYWEHSRPEIKDNGNTVVIHHVHAPDLIYEADFTLTISLINNVVEYAFSDIVEYMVGDETNKFEASDIKQPGVKAIFTNHFNMEIPKIMSNDALYAETKALIDDKTGGPIIEYGNWNIGELIDQWGDKTGERYAGYNKKAGGNFSNSATNGAELDVRNIIFSKSGGLTLELYQYGRDAVLGIGTERISIDIRDGNAKEEEVSGFFSSKTLFIGPNSKELVETILLGGGEIRFRITVTDYVGLTSNYQFVLNSVGFGDALRSL
jgi:hypothetical protein